ncbi:MAG: DNA polymerase III subunit delta [Betaproteobacteria bacterium]|nr:DNA polymerase III subunit delta [Betaproteobacteria bacterium]
MRTEAGQLEATLARGLKSLYVITGDEMLLALEAAGLIRAQARGAGYAERETFIAEAGFEWAKLLEAGQSLSLFSAQRMIDLRIPTGKPGVEGAKMLQRYTEHLPPDVLTLVTLPKLDRQTQASAWFGALESKGVVVSADPIPIDRLGAWLGQRLKRQGHEADDQTLSYIAGRVQGNLLAAHQEVLKLGLLFPPGPLDAEAVKQAVTDVARFDVFQLGETILAADRERFVRVLDGLRSEGTSGVLVLWAIVEEIRALKRVGQLVSGGQPVAQAMRDSRVWGARARLLPSALRRLQPRELDRCLLRAAKADRMLKGVDKRDPWNAMIDLGLRMMPPRPSA